MDYRKIDLERHEVHYAKILEVKIAGTTTRTKERTTWANLSIGLQLQLHYTEKVLGIREILSQTGLSSCWQGSDRYFSFIVGKHPRDEEYTNLDPSGLHYTEWVAFNLETVVHDVGDNKITLSFANDLVLNRIVWATYLLDYNNLSNPTITPLLRSMITSGVAFPVEGGDNDIMERNRKAIQSFRANFPLDEELEG